MKKIILILFFPFIIFLYGSQKKISFDDENINVRDNILYYNEKPFTGVISADDLPNYMWVNVEMKNGYLDGGYDVNLSKLGRLKTKIKNRKIEGRYYSKINGRTMEVEYENGEIQKYIQRDNGDHLNLEMNYLVFDQNRMANGYDLENGIKYEVKNGYYNRGNQMMKIFLNDKRTYLIQEVYENEKLVYRAEGIEVTTDILQNNFIKLVIEYRNFSKKINKR